MVRSNLCFLLVLFSALLSGCGNTSKVVIYNENNYQTIENHKNIRVKSIDGRVMQFYKIRIVKSDDQFIYAECWRTKSAKPIDYKFNKTEIIIESTQFSGSRTAEYVLLVVVIVGLIFLTDRIIH